MKKKVFLGSLLVAVAAVLLIVLSMFLEYTRSTSSEKTVIVEIPKGASESLIADILEENGVIDYKMNFKLKMRSSEYRGKLNYGKYVLNKKMCIDDAIAALSRPSELKKGIRLIALFLIAPIIKMLSISLRAIFSQAPTILLWRQMPIPL